MKLFMATIFFSICARAEITMPIASEIRCENPGGESFILSGKIVDGSFSYLFDGHGKLDVKLGGKFKSFHTNGTERFSLFPEKNGVTLFVVNDQNGLLINIEMSHELLEGLNDWRNADSPGLLLSPSSHLVIKRAAGPVETREMNCAIALRK